MKLLKKKKCKLCGKNPIPKKDTPKIALRTADGIKKMKVCESCFQAMELIYAAKNGLLPEDFYDTEVKEQDNGSV